MEHGRHIATWFLLLVLMIWVPSAHADTPPLTTEGVVREVLQNNDQLAILDAKVRETYRVLDPAGNLDNPRLQAGLMNLPVDSYEFDEQAMTSKDLAVVQKNFVLRDYASAVLRVSD